jgi:predicted metal-dependent enzyme (double-stranded beta helix superfamily)
MSDVTAWLLERLPRDRDLDRAELTELATDLGREPSLWQQHVRHDPNERYFLQLYRDVHVDVWLICWLNAQDTGFHDHDLSSGAVYVVEGVLAEDRFHFDEEHLRTTVRERPAASVFDFDASYIHCMRHAGVAPATSIHVYSPALWRMGYYERDGAGDLCRTSITYMDEVAESSAH